MRRIVPASLTLLILLLFGGASAEQQQNASSPPQGQELARKAYAVLESHCGKCHGSQATGGFTFHDHDAMIEKEQIKLEDFKWSRIYIRAVLREGGPMPPPSQKNALTPEESALLKTWIFAGGPEVVPQLPGKAGKGACER